MQEKYCDTEAIYPSGSIFLIPNFKGIKQGQEGDDEDERGEKSIQRPDYIKYFFELSLNVPDLLREEEQG